MKRILMILALAAACISANAQVKSVSAAETALAKAKAKADNPKKATKTATWIKYGQALLDAYNAPAGNGWLNASRQEIQLVLANDKPVKVEKVELGGATFDKEVYATRNYYYGPENVLSFIEITKPIDPEALNKAADAYTKAAKLDVKGKKSKDIKAALSAIAGKFGEEAYTAYYLGDLAKASRCFESAALTSNTAPLSQIDSNSVYNAGFTAWLAGDLARAEKFLLQSRDMGYLMDGEVYAKLAEIADKAGDAEKGKNYLEEGFQKFPQSQAILVGLINYYLNNNGSTDRLFELLGEAKKNEPNNASLYYVEGNICGQLGKFDDAVAAYSQCAVIDPNYAYGYIGMGQMFYNEAVKLSEAAQNPDLSYKDYLSLVDQSDAALEKCVEPFEKVMEIVQDKDTIRAVAEYLKSACYRLSGKNADYEAKYNTYNELVKSFQQ